MVLAAESSGVLGRAGVTRWFVRLSVLGEFFARRCVTTGARLSG